MTFEEEAKEQVERLKNWSKETFKKEIPDIKREISEMKTPLDFLDIVHIYKWIFRYQIKLEDLKPDILDEFKNTEHYQILKRKNRI